MSSNIQNQIYSNLLLVTGKNLLLSINEIEQLLNSIEFISFAIPKMGLFYYPQLNTCLK